MQRIADCGWRIHRIALSCVLILFTTMALPAAKVEFVEELLEPGCMAGLVNHPGTAETDGPFLLFWNPQTTERAHRERKDVTIKASFDQGRTWPICRLLQAGPSAPSDLAVLPDATILCFYESGRRKSSRKARRPSAYAALTVRNGQVGLVVTSCTTHELREHGGYALELPSSTKWARSRSTRAPPGASIALRPK